LISVFIILLSVVEGRSSVPAALAASFRFVHSNGLHPSHRKWGRVYYRSSWAADCGDGGGVTQRRRLRT